MAFGFGILLSLCANIGSAPRLSLLDDDNRDEVFSRLAAITAANQEYIDTLLAIVAHETATASDVAARVKADVNIPAILVPTLRAGQESGELAAFMSAEDTTAMVVNSLFLLCFTRRSEDIDQQVHAVMVMLFQGLLARTPDGPLEPSAEA